MFKIPARYRDVKRFEQILSVLAKNELGMILEKSKMKKVSLHTPKIDATPERIRKIFEELGGSFVKLGQLLSLRPDLIPFEYCQEFSKLQDKVPPFPTEQVEKIIEDDLGKPTKKLFQSFHLKPEAAASIGQVHKAHLKTGEDVAVKIRRPGIEKTITSDIDILVYFANLLEKHFKPKVFSPRQIVAEFKDYTEKEFDFSREATNIDLFYKNFQGSEITIPKVYWKTCSPRVITMEFIDGVVCKDIISGKKGLKHGFNRKIIANKLSTMMFKQVFEDGIFHADPHPGNILIEKGNSIALLDFGIVGKVNPALKEKLTRLFIALIQRDLDGLANAFVRLNIVDHDVDMDSFKQDLSESLSKYYDKPLSEISLSALITEGFTIARRNNVQLPKNFVLLGKAIITLEGTCVELDPEFNLVEVATPYVKGLVAKRMKPSELAKRFAKQAEEAAEFVQDLPAMGRDTYAAVKNADEQLKHIDKEIKFMTKEMGKASSRLILGLLIGAFIISAALVADLPQGSMLGYPAYSFSAILMACMLGFVLLLSVIEEKLHWRN